MWAITHLLTGMAIGAVVPGGLGAGIAAALLGHLALDLVPHWDYTGQPHKFVWGAIDVAAVTAVVLIGWLLLGLPSQMLVCGLVSAAPDLDILNATLPYAKRTRWFPSHWTGFPHGKAHPLPGVAVQVLLWVISLGLVARYG